MNPAPSTETAACILAGGRATRMGGVDKCRLRVGGRPVIALILDVLRPQVATLALNANGDPSRFADLGLPVLPDGVPDQPGPLAGVLAGLDWAAGLGFTTLLSVPGDTPFLPGNLVARLRAARGEGGFSCAASAGHLHPAVALWPVACRDALRDALARGERRVRAFAPQVAVEWPAVPRDPFLNLNTPEDLATC